MEGGGIFSPIYRFSDAKKNLINPSETNLIHFEVNVVNSIYTVKT